MTTRAVTVADSAFIRQVRELETAGNSEAVAEAFAKDREMRLTDVLAATHGKHVPMPFAGLWAPYVDAGPTSDVFRPGDVLALLESGSVRPRQAVAVGFHSDPVRHVQVYLGVAQPGNPLLSALEVEAPAAVFWDGCETDSICARPLADLRYLMPVIGYTTGAEPFYPLNEWPLLRRARAFVMALESRLDPVELVAIADNDSIPLKPCADGGSGVH